MKILVTGANGYIGSHVVKKLIDMNFDIVATDLLTTNIDKRAKIIESNLFLDDNLYELFDEPDVIIHLAWEDGFKLNSYKHILRVNEHFRFLTSMIKSGTKQIVVMGSMHEVGAHEGIVKEDTPCCPISIYGAAKHLLKISLMDFCQKENIIFQWLRAYYITGEDDKNNSIFSKILAAQKAGLEVFPFTDGKNKFDFLDIDELSTQIASVSIQKNIAGIIDCCSGVPISLGEKVEQFLKENKIDIKLEYNVFPPRAGESKITYGDPSKIKKIMKL